MDLYEACCEGDFEFVKDRVEKGLDQTTINKCFSRACCHGREKVARYLFETAGAEIDYDEDIAIRFAAIYGNVEIVKMLLGFGGNLKKAFGAIIMSNDQLKNCMRDETVEPYFSHIFKHYDMLHYFLDLGADKNTGLKMACNHNRLDFAKLFVERGADVTHDNNLAVRLAADNGFLKIVKFLVEKGADITAQNNNCLMRASRFGFEDLVQFLLDHGADVHANNDRALHNACQNGHFQTIQLLIKHGADVKADNNRALALASRSGDLRIIQLLIKHGADVTADNNRALTNACINGFVPVVACLVEHGADVRAQNDFAVRFAAKNSFFEMFTFLVSKGADVRANNDEILKYAIDDLNYDIIDFLIINRKIDATTLDDGSVKFLFTEREKELTKAANFIGRWWIPICYDTKRESGKRMAEKNWERMCEINK